MRIGEDVVFRDGLFSQNPPIRDFMDRYKHNEVRKIEMLRELDASTLERRPPFIREMFAYGEEQAEGVLGRGVVAHRYAPTLAEHNSSASVARMGFSDVRMTPVRHP